jgi:ribose transport system substrate-binding protein
MKRLAVLFIALSVVVGCGGEKAAQDGAAPADDRLEIAVIPKGVSHQFWLTVKAGADKAGEDLGVDVLWQGPAKETEVDKQLNIFQDMISRGADAVVLAATDENALMVPVQQAMDQGIPVVTIDSGLKENISVSFIATDNVAGAKAAAEKLIELIGGEGKVGLIPFVPGAATSELREQGFKEGVAEHPGVEIAATLYSQSDVARAVEITEDMLTSNPDLKGIFAANEPACVGVAQTLKVAGKAGTVMLVGFDASEEQINHLKDGTVQALIVQNPFRMGYLGVQTAVAAIKGEPVEKRIDTGVLVVTKENLDDPEVQAVLNPDI